MLAYSIIMFLGAVILVGMGIAIYRGKTDLIHDYHQTNVTDKAAYGKAFAKVMFSFSLTLVFSGITALFGEAKTIVVASVAILLIGLIISFIVLVKVQKKYNGGVF